MALLHRPENYLTINTPLMIVKLAAYRQAMIKFDINDMEVQHDRDDSGSKRQIDE